MAFWMSSVSINRKLSKFLSVAAAECYLRLEESYKPDHVMPTNNDVKHVLEELVKLGWIWFLCKINFGNMLAVFQKMAVLQKHLKSCLSGLGHIFFRFFFFSYLSQVLKAFTKHKAWSDIWAKCIFWSSLFYGLLAKAGINWHVSKEPKSFIV